MRIAIDFKNRKEEYKRELEKRDFHIYESSMGSVWVDDLNVITYMDLTDRDGFKIRLENKVNLQDYSIYLEDIEYFEIHKD